MIVFGCVCAWTTWRRPGANVFLWAGVRHGVKASFLRSVPDQMRVGLVCLRPLWI